MGYMYSILAGAVRELGEKPRLGADIASKSACVENPQDDSLTLHKFRFATLTPSWFVLPAPVVWLQPIIGCIGDL